MTLTLGELQSLEHGRFHSWGSRDTKLSALLEDREPEGLRSSMLVSQTWNRSPFQGFLCFQMHVPFQRGQAGWGKAKIDGETG